MNKKAGSIQPGSEGLVFLPILAGTHFPEYDKDARGVFYGIPLKHSKAHFTRAIMESIGYMLKKILASVERFGIEIEEIYSMGGGARSDMWLQIKSDICGFSIVKMQEEETSTLGAVILTSVKVGDYSTVDEAVRFMVKTGQRFQPNKKNSALYQKNFMLYRDLYDNLALLFKQYSS